MRSRDHPAMMQTMAPPEAVAGLSAVVRTLV
jgi:hypothetical protein